MIVLCMIVKDEAHVIRRCLESVKPFIDAWVIADTGSADDTPAIVRDAMAGLGGVFVASEWADFATNRNRVLDVARTQFPGAHFALTIDADETLTNVGPSILGESDAYTLDVEYGTLRYRRTALFRLDKPFRWRGVVHEFLHCDEPYTTGHLPAPTVRVFHEGARSRDPETYRKDAALLEAALSDCDDDLIPRYQFYLAESYRYAGETERARGWYEVRASNPAGYQDERWWSLYQCGLLYESAVLRADCLLDAYAMQPHRAEPLVALAALERELGRFAPAALYADRACALPMPSDGLFIDTDAYAFRRWDELAISGFYAGYDVLDAATIAATARPDDPRAQENLRMIREARP